MLSAPKEMTHWEAKKLKEFNADMKDSGNARMPLLEQPLHYMANPDMFIGDALQDFGVESDMFDTSEQDTYERNKVQLNPFVSSDDKRKAHLWNAAEYTGGAVINGAIELATVGMASGAVLGFKKYAGPALKDFIAAT